MELLKVLSGTSRLPFLLLVPVSICSGYAAALFDKNLTNTTIMNLIMLVTGCLAAHICVNMLNEYFDYKSGLDSETIKTPFSGGSGTLHKYPQYASVVLFTALLFSLIVFTSGVYFLFIRGSIMLPFVISGLLVIYLYTPFLVCSSLICLLSPGLGFGLFMVNGSYAALTGSLSLTSLIISLIITFLVSNLLLLNQFPDIDQDSKYGRKNILIVYGKNMGAFVYVLFLFLTTAIILGGCFIKLLPPQSLFSIFFLMLGILSCFGTCKNLKSPEKISPFLGINVAVTLVTPLTVAISLIIQ